MPLLAPQASTITLSTASTVVQANGTTEIRATVLEPSGTPVQNGTTVTFTTNLGALSPAEARTLNGVATVQFVAQRPIGNGVDQGDFRRSGVGRVGTLCRRRGGGRSS